jgi:hypothetical protein
VRRGYLIPVGLSNPSTPAIGLTNWASCPPSHPRVDVPDRVTLHATREGGEMKGIVRVASVVLTLLLVSASAPSDAGIHTTNGVRYGGNLLSCQDTCLIHSHTSSDNISFKIADFWDPTNKGYFYDCNCQHAHHTKNVSAFWACSWDAANSSAKPYLRYHTHGNIC